MRLEGNSSAQECPGEGFHPLVLVNLTQLDDSSPKGFLEVLMLTFHRAVGLLVVCWREENLMLKVFMMSWLAMKVLPL